MNESNLTRSCYKYNQTISNQIENCDGNPNNQCFTVWEFVNDNLTNFTNIQQSDFKLSLKDCWLNHPKDRDCNYKSTPKKALICFCKNDNCNKLDSVNIEFIKSNVPPFNTTYVKPDIVATDQLNNQNHLIFYLFPILILIIIIFTFFYKHRNKLSKKLNCMNQSINVIKKNHHNNIEQHIQEPLLNKTQPKIIEHLKQGQYGNVYKGKIERKQQSTEQLQLVHAGQNFHNQSLDLEQTVAIKAYSQQMYDSFKHEYNVYNLPHLKHKNILKFISAEEGRRLSPINNEYWLILEYHENGSLYDFLKRNLVTYSQLLEICLNIATGLSHLHNNSVVVVHRDLKSKNILLKNDLTAVISDFNLALILYPNQLPSENLDQVGTVRYMSPEVLDCAIQFSKEGLTKIDIYSTSLIFWEVLSRCSAQLGPVEPYSMPYEKELGVGTFLIKEQLRKHVSENKQRPKIPDHWCDHSDLKEFAKTINDSWDNDAEARLTASGIVERLKRIKEKNDN